METGMNSTTLAAIVALATLVLMTPAAEAQVGGGAAGSMHPRHAMMMEKLAVRKISESGSSGSSCPENPNSFRPYASRHVRSNLVSAIRVFCLTLPPSRAKPNHRPGR
jgi:hypothetical protein